MQILERDARGRFSITRRLVLWHLVAAAFLPIAACAKREGSHGPSSRETPACDGGGDYTVRFETSKGTFLVAVHSSWAPNGARRFHELTESGYYDGCRFYRVVKDFMAQTGVNGDPLATARWTGRPIDDDPPRMSNKRGTVCMARSGAPNSATAQFFINTRDNSFLDGQGYSPLGCVLEGMSVVDSLYSGYGECGPMGQGPEQRRVVAEGNAYLAEGFPDLDHVITATLK